MKKDLKIYLQMSPFEIKNELIEAAVVACKKDREAGGKKEVLNAGRGNPNFLNTKARRAFSELEKFATELSSSYSDIEDVGMRPEKKGIAKKLDDYVEKNKNEDAKFLQESIQYAEEMFEISPDELVFELADAALGDFYPVPPRIFPHTETIVKAYLNQILSLGENPKKMNYDLFATEGASAAMIYVFNSLKFNHLIKEGDQIAIFTPIFSPYLEIPLLKEYNLKEVYIEAKEELEWQIPDSEIEKLKNPNIKAAYIVNPTNPTSVAIRDASLEKIANLVKHHRKDLIILTDTVYAPFVENFHSIFKEIPQNTIMVYSYSKYFGVTGWRLGVVMMHKQNIIDKLIGELPTKSKEELHQRYKIVSPDPEHLPFIERLEMDSRAEALAHTGGLSCPQQAIMALFSLFNLLNKDQAYRKAVHQILKKRITNLFDNLEVPRPEEKDHTYYYTVIDVNRYARIKYGDEFADHLNKDVDPIEFLFKLAEERFIICLPGEGFAAPKWSLRISLANLHDEAYIEIGKAIREMIADIYKIWKKGTHNEQVSGKDPTFLE